MGDRFNLFRKAALTAQSILGSNPLLATLEKSLVCRDTFPGPPPLFIIGAPRTGSTLLLQVLAARFRFTCLTNIQSFFYVAPVLVGMLFARMIRKANQEISFSSRYGYMPGLFAPSEAGAIFRRWFGDNDFSKKPPPVSGEIVRASVSHLSNKFEGPFLAKNLNNSLRLRRISSIFPDAVFVWIRRQWAFVCQSILEMRRKVMGSEHLWVSVMPPGSEDIMGKSPLEQVAWQVAAIERNIELVIKEKGIRNIITIDYETLCQEAQAVVEEIRKFYEGCTRVTLAHNMIQLPKLHMGNLRRLGENEWMELCSHLSQYAGDGVGSGPCAGSQR